LRRLAALALERITALGERATELEQRKAILGAKLRMLNLKRGSLEEAVGGRGDTGAEIAALERELKATVDNYVEAKASLSTLETRLEQVNAIFGAPAQHVNLARIELRVNKTGFKVDAASSEPASDLKLTELAIGDGFKAIIAFVRCQRTELPPKETLSSRAARAAL